MKDRLNRVLLGIIGLSLLVVGGAVVLAHGGSWEPGDDLGAGYEEVATEVRALDEPALIALALAAGVLGLLGLWWAYVQVRAPRRRRRLTRVVLHRGDRGELSFEPVAAAHALEADLRRADGVLDAGVRVVRLDERARVVVELDLAEDTGPGAAGALAQDRLARLARALQRPVDAEVRLHLDAGPRPRLSA